MGRREEGDEEKKKEKGKKKKTEKKTETQLWFSRKGFVISYES